MKEIVTLHENYKFQGSVEEMVTPKHAFLFTSRSGKCGSYRYCRSLISGYLGWVCEFESVWFVFCVLVG